MGVKLFKQTSEVQQRQDEGLILKVSSQSMFEITLWGVDVFVADTDLSLQKV